MHMKLRRQFYCPIIENNVYQTAKECRSCTAVRGTIFKHRKKMKLFPAAGPLEFVSMDYLNPLPKSNHGKQ